ncbi:VENN motif pre-toxin domain-containing protein [Pantoea sp. ACRSH]|uniref:VENN motif pre-toxin domain-containing protein n=1 Tax=unclassified Pantoea TaxID=2630326 RepID=UPI001EF70771|nr:MULTISPECIES: VENN motif pre-toxin domain-containing protein [unclassified Pantoea]MCG7366324.1 VENN motif pre-toxin domain-containing protein [Pantoea sp. ACRSH]MCG7396812.1 VENN motif pre-toxin domain-containing protein [Pantoea sp. ACRSC]
MAPYLANAIRKATTTYDAQGNPNTVVLTNTMAHAVAGAVLAQIAGGSAAAGAAGAAGGELAAKAIVKVMYPDTDISDLTESQKQMVSALSQMAAGLAGGIASDSALGGGTGAGAGKNAVEINALSDLHEQLITCESQIDKFKKQLKIDEEKFSQENCAGISADACTVKFYDHRKKELNEITSTTADFIPVVGTIKSLAEAESALDYLEVAASLIPGERVAAGVFKSASKALDKGGIGGASRLINLASDDIGSAKYFLAGT